MGKTNKEEEEKRVNISILLFLAISENIYSMSCIIAPLTILN